MNLSNIFFGMLLITISQNLNLVSQETDKQIIIGDNHRIVFYNVENYFDSKIDSTRSYNEFTPDGQLHWTERKYQEKRAHIFQALTAIAEWEPITLMGFVEIENAFVLQDLINSTPLSRENYQLVHFESDDYRGIDVGLIYHADRFNLLSAQKITVKDRGDPTFTTRDILYVKGLLANDTLHVFVNHWVSRWRGVMESKYLRVLCAETLKRVVDSVCALNPNANILLMGDFNDNPEDDSILKLTADSGDCQLFNVVLKPANKDVRGTLKYGSEWSYFDQFLVSGSLLSGETSLMLDKESGRVFDPPYLLENDKKHLGVKPNRTHIGFKYNGGFSDHLPIFIDIFVHRSK